ncbi:MarR family winged helix-turn-helix transcriptional regulator [Allopusillimonas ginsengisoli]|uniref:MarR family winged helix-turn-helix transcriptional regulator n=1 Tax=Allopusillimonas ginsengisoli TaxID=453575 RepID=UPI0010220F89|nr:MarR family transcriptional regulator [Allopusillimonas ginsengisoli]TEA79456.1 MarR family transcriptional regulator [Allopusillimonas ginsengisoli]
MKKAAAPTPAKSTAKADAQRRRAQSFYKATSASLAPDVNLGHLIKQLQSSLNRMMEQKLAPLGLTAMQWRPLALIRFLNINTPAELSRRTFIDTGAMTRALDRLEAKKFITRHRCPEDRRVVRVALTDAGNDVADHILPAVAATLNTHLDDFSVDEINTLIGLIQRMLVNGDQSVEDDASRA